MCIRDRVYTLSQMGFDCGVNSKTLKKINDFFLPEERKFIDNGTFDPTVLAVKADALVYQIPGGMLSNLMAQLKAQGAIDRLDEVLEETPRVRADLGYPPLVTPLSQMVGVQDVYKRQTECRSSRPAGRLEDHAAGV